MNKYIAKAIEIAGSQAKLAEQVGVSQVSVCRWLNNKKKVSPERVIAVVKATGGVIKPYQIRPDLPMLFPHSEN
ncbi:transcriptional regulator [Cronobacter dublinensis]|uniref:transcriptional regulator n=1 Tax=Cronobacter dublinensis TaxID=413497 RepID=UPI0024AE33A1|nr:helix-turn-helix domain-containing protein [Cronobacter dublinensis]MDI6443773.1 helix-turn-helix domain-containing protein [Cronobacter dublinensis]